MEMVMLSFGMLGIPAINPELHRTIVEVAPRDGLPELTSTEIDVVEYLRLRYDALIGIIDPEEAGVDPSDVQADREAYPDCVDISMLDSRQFKFINDHTTIGDSKVATYLYYILVEELACGLINLTIDELVETMHLEYDHVLAMQ